MTITQSPNQPTARRIAFGGYEHQQREIHALHQHHTSDQIGYWGNGRTVMAVVKTRRPFVEILGEGDPDFRYADYFLPEELA